VTAPAPATVARLAVRLARNANGALVASGSGPAGARVSIALLRDGRRVAVKRVRINRSGRFRAAFRATRPGRYTVAVSGQGGGRRLAAHGRPVAVR
jgi:hypothetical protein